jgi:hypothetical protein
VASHDRFRTATAENEQDRRAATGPFSHRSTETPGRPPTFPSTSNASPAILAGAGLSRFKLETSNLKLDSAIERLYDLNTGITPLAEGTPHERPHKPLLLLAAFDLIDDGLATPDRIPSFNDHPTNGLALCKNHHWATDRNLIAPCPDHHWQVSRVLDSRRSNGEMELLNLAGKSVLLPKDPAFHPDRKALEWRCQWLIA